jgi:hypothetical protein
VHGGERVVAPTPSVRSFTEVRQSLESRWDEVRRRQQRPKARLQRIDGNVALGRARRYQHRAGAKHQTFTREAHGRINSPRLSALAPRIFEPVCQHSDSSLRLRSGGATSRAT